MSVHIYAKTYTVRTDLSYITFLLSSRTYRKYALLLGKKFILSEELFFFVKGALSEDAAPAATAAAATAVVAATRER